MINRRIPAIIVPLDNSSLSALYEQRDDQGDYFVLPISREDLSILFNSGFFDKINSQFDLSIDEYEEVELTDLRQISHLKAFLQGNSFEDPLCNFYARKLTILVIKALKLKTAVLFYF